MHIKQKPLLKKKMETKNAIVKIVAKVVRNIKKSRHKIKANSRENTK